MGAGAALLVIIILSIVLRNMPGPGIVASLMLIGTGIGLVVARFGNAGPFQGELGSPWFEADLADILKREIARAARFDRDLSFVVVRQLGGNPVEWTDVVRDADQVFACRNGWSVLVLAETSKDGAQRMIERATVDVNARVQAVIMDPSITSHDPKKLGKALTELLRNPPDIDSTSAVAVHRSTDRLRWPVN